MNYIAARYPEGTHWEKTAEGYQLSVGPPKQTPSFWWRLRRVAVITGVLLNAMLASAVGFALLRRSRKLAPQPVSAGEALGPAVGS
jgi:hypothetical protein